MNVISCPTCLRQYTVERGMDGRLGQCGGCKATFFISVAELATGEPALSLIEEIGPRVGFMKEGCAEFMRNLFELETLLDDDLRQGDLLGAIRDTFRIRANSEERWLQSNLGKALKRAFDRTRDTPELRMRYERILGYFAHDIRCYPSYVRDMLEGAILGVFETVVLMEAEKAGAGMPHPGDEVMSLPGE